MEALKDMIDIPIEHTDGSLESLEYDDIEYHRRTFLVRKDVPNSTFWQAIGEWIQNELADRHADKLLMFTPSLVNLNLFSDQITVEFVSVCTIQKP